MMARNVLITPKHLAGLVVGEGCFYVESCADPKYRSGWRIRPAFCVEMRADEIEVLEALQRELGCGGIYHLDFGRYRGYRTKDWQPHAKFRVSNTADLVSKVLPFFEEHGLFGRKRRAFELFAQIVRALDRKEHLHEDGLLQIRATADQLRQHNHRGKAAPHPRGPDSEAI